MDIDALCVGAFDHVSCDLRRGRPADLHAGACPKQLRAPAGFQRMIPIDSHISQTPAKLRITPARTIRHRQNSLVRKTKLVVFDSHAVHELSGDERTDANWEEDMFKTAVGNSNVL